MEVGWFGLVWSASRARVVIEPTARTTADSDSDSVKEDAYIPSFSSSSRKRRGFGTNLKRSSWCRNVVENDDAQQQSDTVRFELFFGLVNNSFLSKLFLFYKVNDVNAAAVPFVLLFHVQIVCSRLDLDRSVSAAIRDFDFDFCSRLGPHIRRGTLFYS